MGDQLGPIAFVDGTVNTMMSTTRFDSIYVEFPKIETIRFDSIRFDPRTKIEVRTLKLNPTGSVGLLDISIQGSEL